MPMMRKRSILMAAFAGLSLTTSSTIASSSDAQVGKELARRVCATCHVVVEGQPSGDPNAPSFRSIAQSQKFHEKGVALLWEKHPKMPTLALTPEQLDDLAACIKSLAN